MSREEQKAAVEALLFSSEEPISLKLMFDLLIVRSVSDAEDEMEAPGEENKEQLSLSEEIMNKFDFNFSYFEELIEEINAELEDSYRPYHIVNVAGGWQFATKPEYGEALSRLTKSKSRRRFSQASLEALAIIAYKQPISKPEIERIRGVNSNEIVNSLLEKKLIKIAGRKKTLGKPLLYGTTDLFLKTFGLKSLEDLPKLREIEEIASSNFTPEESNIEIDVDSDEKQNLKDIQKELERKFEIDS